MAKRTPANTKTKKRQQTKKSRLPSSSASKKNLASAKNRKILPTRLKTLFRKIRRREPFSLRLTRSRTATFTLGFSRQKKPAKKKSSKKAREQLSFEQNLITSVIMIAIGLTGTIYAGTQITGTALGAQAPVQNQLIDFSESPAKHFLPASKPVHLSIPSVWIDTDLKTVGKNPDDSMEVPEDFHRAGWYKHSPTPGEKGPSIIVGHVDNHKGLGVFWELRNLKKGQIIKVKRADGRTVKFKVDTIKQYPQNSLPAKEVFGNIDYAGLRLITCGGKFNYITHHYSDNTVVYASLADNK
ncbi:MAG TPA: class F sortase [Candidatus Saccharimonadales bacterium]|nr:class F sortase [Candidatus Saccharimonadales bacterium]